MGYVHFVRSPHAHAKIVSDRRLGGARARRRLRDADRRRGRDPDRPVLRDVDRRRARTSRTTRSPSAACGSWASRSLRSVASDARARARRRRARRGRVRAARRARRRARRRSRTRPSCTTRPARTSSGAGVFDWGDWRRRRRPRPTTIVKIDELHFHRFSLDAARVLGRARRVRPRHRPVDAALQPPDARRRRDLDGAGAAHRDRQAALRHAATSAAASATRSACTRTT